MNMQQELVKYNVTDAAIEAMSHDYRQIIVAGPDDEEGAKRAHQARMVVKNKRVEVEKTRVELKADALAYGRAVDAEAKRITALLAPIEKHLDAQESVVTEAKKRAAAAAAEAQRARREAEEHQAREAEEAALRLERERLARERAAMEEAQRVERERLAAERAAMEAERLALQEAQRAEQERRRAEAQQAEAERQRAAEAARLEAMQPDVKQFRDWGRTIVRAWTAAPKIVSAASVRHVHAVGAHLTAAAQLCAAFGTDTDGERKGLN